MMSRQIFTATPASLDLVLSRSGMTWNVDRATDRGTVMRVSAGHPTRAAAQAELRTLAQNEKVDAWEIEGPGSYRRVTGCRPSTKIGSRHRSL
jgi:hypothetical protein